MGTLEQGRDGWDELLKEAHSRLAEQEAEEAEAGAELGESVQLDERGVFTGRWRGYGKAWAKRDGEYVEVGVFLAWDAEGQRRFFWPTARLQREIDDVQPNVGDEIAVVRGADIPNSDPNKNATQRYSLRARRCYDPLPEARSGDDDVPF